MRILVTGANGQLGRSLRLVARDSVDEYIYTDVNDLDITDKEAVEQIFNDYNFDLVVNCAAYTDVERAETDESMAELINAIAVRNLAQSASKHNATLIHISTDYVFDGSQHTPIKESETPNPTGAYGRTKLHGEQAIAESGCNHLIIRTAWLYSEFGKNFVKTILKLCAERNRLTVVCDQIGTPTYARDLASTIFEIIENRKYEGREGIYNFTNEGVASWYDFAKAIAEVSGNKTCDIKPCRSDEYPTKVKRPDYSILDKSKIKSCFNLNIPYWVDSLQVCINNLNQQS